jgi:hypothetical protein
MSQKRYECDYSKNEISGSHAGESPDYVPVCDIMHFDRTVPTFQTSTLKMTAEGSSQMLCTYLHNTLWAGIAQSV